jgi:hypothetical protein
MNSLATRWPWTKNTALLAASWVYVPAFQARLGLRGLDQGLCFGRQSALWAIGLTADLHPPEGEDIVAAVSAALGRTALDLTAHVEAV